MRKFTLFMMSMFLFLGTAMAQNYSLTETRLSSGELNAKTASTLIAIKNLSATNNYYFVGNTGAVPYSAAEFSDAAVFVWQPVVEGTAGSYYLMKPDGTYMQATSPKDFGTVDGAAVFTSSNPTTANGEFSDDPDSQAYIDDQALLVRFMNTAAGNWINVQNGDGGTPLYNTGTGGWTIHYIYAVEAATVEPEPEPEPEPAAAQYRVKTEAGYLNIGNTDEHATGPIGGVNVVAYAEDNNQIFTLEDAGDGNYYLKSASGYYVFCQAWNVDGLTEKKTALTFEKVDESNFYIKHAGGYFKVQEVDGIYYPFCDAPIAAAATWSLEEVGAVEPEPEPEVTAGFVHSNTELTLVETTEYPEGITTAKGDEATGEGCTTGVVKSAVTAVNAPAAGNVTVAFQYQSGNHKLVMLGVDVLDLDGNVVKGDYHYGFTGGNTQNNTYTIEGIDAGDYQLRYFFCHKANDHEAGNQVAQITVTGLNKREAVEPEPEDPATVVITSVDQLSNDKLYTIVSKDTGRGGMFAGEGATLVDMCGVTYNNAQACHSIERDANDPRQQFAFVNYEGKFYLYSVSEKKFVAKNGDVNKLTAEAPFDYITVTLEAEAGGDYFSLFINDANYITASPGWCSNTSRNTCLQTTLTGKIQGDGWDDGAWFTITQVGDFDATEALALLNATTEPEPEPEVTVEIDATKEYYLKSSWNYGLNSGYLTLGNKSGADYGHAYMANESSQAFKFTLVEDGANKYYTLSTEITGTMSYTAYIDCSHASNVNSNAMGSSNLLLELENATSSKYVVKTANGYLKADMVSYGTDGSAYHVFSNGDRESALVFELVEKADAPEVAAPVITAITPADGAEVTSLSEVVLTFDKAIKEVDTMNGIIKVKTAGSTSRAYGYAAKISDDGLTVTFPIGDDMGGFKTIDAKGEYTIEIPAGVVTSVDGAKNEAATSTFTIVAATEPEPEVETFAVTANIYPVVEGDITEIKNIRVQHNEGPALSDFPTEWTLTNEAGDTFPMSFDWGLNNWDDILITVNPSITAAGTYTLTIPAGSLTTDDGKECEAATFSWTVVGPVDPYMPRNNGTRENAGRLIKGITLTGASGVNSYALTETEQTQDYTDATAEAVFKVEAGEELTITFDKIGEWIHQYVFIDYDGDGFTASIEAGSNYAPAEDLVAYSFYNNDDASDELGWNSVGDMITGNNRSTPAVPAFIAPEKVGKYRMRVKQDWCNIDPAGDADGKFKDFKENGGQIIDVILEVVEQTATGIENVEVETVNAIYDLTGRKIEKITEGGIYIVNGKKVLVK